MPAALFLMSLMVSAGMFATSNRISRDNRLNQQVLANTRAFYSTEANISIVEAKDFSPAENTDGGIGDVQQELITGSNGATPSLVSSEKLESTTGERLQIKDENDVFTQVFAQTTRSARPEVFQEELYQETYEFYFVGLSALQSFSKFDIEYCAKKNHIGNPEDCLITLEWFEVPQSSATFVEIEDVKGDSFDVEVSESSSLVKRATYKVQGANIDKKGEISAVVQANNISLSNLPPDPDSNFQYGVSLSVADLSATNYLIRMRNAKGPGHFTMRFAFKDSSGNFKTNHLPTNILQVDDAGNNRSSFARIKSQKQSFAGILPVFDYGISSHVYTTKDN